VIAGSLGNSANQTGAIARHAGKAWDDKTVNITWSAIGFFLGFGFGVGCALAVMYSIFMGGYRAAVKDAAKVEAPQRLARVKHALGIAE
jgi:hypothetical protein